MSQIRESFKRDLAPVSWKELRAHLQRDAIILVSPTLDLIETAVAVADDDKNSVETWIAEGLLGKPTAEQLDCWEAELDMPFNMLIVQPFILIQEVCNA